MRHISYEQSSIGTSKENDTRNMTTALYLVAEDVTSRSLNVMSLFNGLAPFIAIQLQALKIGENLTLVFTKVMDELSRGLTDEDEDAEAVPTDRSYREQKASKERLDRRRLAGDRETVRPDPEP